MSFFRYMVVSALILVTSAATQPPGLQNNGSDEAARNSDNPIQRVLEQFFVKKAKGMEMEKAIAEMASTIKNMMATIDAMKSSISSLERDIANRKEFRCESGVLGQHTAPAPNWPYGQTITFQTAFQEMPTVTYGLYLLDSAGTVNLRVSTEVKDITRGGFSINLARWGDSVLYGARVSWMACGR
ncbi:uncharacterized protein LOC133192546 [Saccostrea echinata]|uniref:uncharacterized protein LOC133192546 n=1 Tax=Saccostrea echinata TaxID=191078 RepID=UPI002A7EBD31|nr:uncharacterized protein LOC133192546 [Saccostrea echinata]